MKFSDKLKNIREEKDVSQEDLAKAIGVSLRSIQYYETRERYPRDRKIYYKLAEFFGVDVNYFLTENEEFLDEAAIKYGRKGQLQAAELLEQTKGLLAGGDLSPEDQKSFVLDMQRLFFIASDIASEKFDPTKNKKKK